MNVQEAKNCDSVEWRAGEQSEAEGNRKFPSTRQGNRHSLGGFNRCAAGSDIEQFLFFISTHYPAVRKEQKKAGRHYLQATSIVDVDDDSYSRVAINEWAVYVWESSQVHHNTSSSSSSGLWE